MPKSSVRKKPPSDQERIKETSKIEVSMNQLANWYVDGTMPKEKPHELLMPTLPLKLLKVYGPDKAALLEKGHSKPTKKQKVGGGKARAFASWHKRRQKLDTQRFKN